MKIYLLSEGTTAVIPIVPSNIFIGRKKDTIEKETVNGSIYRKGKLGSLQVQWSSFFPVNKTYSFVNADSWKDGHQYVSFINDIRKNDKECRCCILDDSGYGMANFLCDITNFTYTSDKIGDIPYTITLCELRSL